MGINQVSVVADPVNAYPGGSNLLALANGSLAATFPTVPGRTYTLKLPYRGPGIAGWWRGENNANDSHRRKQWHIGKCVTYTNGEVGQAFRFDGTNGYVQIPIQHPA